MLVESAEQADVVGRVETFSRLRHRVERSLRAQEDPRRADPADVGRIAAKLATLYHADVPGDDTADSVRRARCAGLMVVAMEAWGINFEGVCDVADVGVAWVVAGCSGDNTQAPHARRDRLRAKLAESPVESQLVKLAEIRCVALRVLDVPALVVGHAAGLEEWAGEARGLLGAMHRVQASPRVAKVHGEVFAAVAKVAKLAAAALAELSRH